MSNSRALLSEEDYIIQLKKCIERFSKAFDKNIGSTVFVKTEKDLVTAVSGADTTCLAFEFAGTTRVEHIFLTLLREACDKAEAISGCSAQILVKILLHLLETNQTLNGVEEFIKTDLYNCSDPITSDQFRSLVLNVVDQDQILADTIEGAMQLAGFDSKIIVDDKTSSAATVIEYSEGYTFQVNHARSFLNQSNNTWEQKKVKVFLVDGTIEKISELHGILTETYNSKLPLLLIARGYGEEVIATLKANQTYSLLNAIPVKINSDLESINILNDIAIVCGAKICSSLSGDVVSLTDYESLPVVDSVFCADTSLVITNHATKNAVNLQIKHLLSKKDGEQGAVGDLRDLIDKRIKCLISSNVTIKLPNISEARKNIMMSNLDFGFRTAKAAINYGVVNREKLFMLKDLTLVKCFKKALNNVPDPIPALALASALKLGVSTASLLLNTSAVLELD